jgi:hypothetical protein
MPRPLLHQEAQYEQTQIDDARATARDAEREPFVPALPARPRFASYAFTTARLTHCNECGQEQAYTVAEDIAKQDCINCNERLAVSCRDCSRDFALSELTGERCDECHVEHEDWLARQKAIENNEGRGDWLRDCQKDGGL